MMSVDFKDLPQPQTALAPVPPPKTRNAGKCSYCRGKQPQAPQNCFNSSCSRRFHSACNRSSLKDLCSECAEVCASCWGPISNPVVCSFCQLRFHSACSPLLDSVDQLCSFCVREQLRYGIDHCIAAETKGGKIYHVVKFACVSWIHRCRIGASKCKAKDHEMGYFERTPFVPMERIKYLYGSLQFEGCMEGDGKLYWEPLETIATYNQLLDREKGLNIAPEIQPIASERQAIVPEMQAIAPIPAEIPLSAAVRQARDLLLSSQYCPFHPERFQACMQYHEILDDAEGSVLRICRDLYEAALKGENSIERHQVLVEVRAI